MSLYSEAYAIMMKARSEKMAKVTAAILEQWKEDILSAAEKGFDFIVLNYKYVALEGDEGDGYAYGTALLDITSKALSSEGLSLDWTEVTSPDEETFTIYIRVHWGNFLLQPADF